MVHPRPGPRFSHSEQDTVIARDSSDDEEERGCKLPEVRFLKSGCSVLGWGYQEHPSTFCWAFAGLLVGSTSWSSGGFPVLFFFIAAPGC